MINILFVDDEQFIISGMERIFKTLAKDWTVDLTSSVNEALEMLDINTYDVVVSDMYMPEMSGIDFLKLVKSKQPQAIRIMLSGYMENTIDSPQQKSAHVYLSKPMKTQSFIEIIKNCLANKEEILEDTYE